MFFRHASEIFKNDAALLPHMGGFLWVFGAGHFQSEQEWLLR